MHFDPVNHPFFTSWEDPQSGTVSHLLHERIAPLQKSWYFVNNPLSPDSHWFWFEAAHPPGNNKHLAAVCLDTAHPEIRSFPHATISAETPVLDAEGRVIFSPSESSPEIWRIDIEGMAELLFTLPEEMVRGRKVQRTGTHFTISSDGKHLLFDGKLGNEWYVAWLDLDTKAFNQVKTFTRHYNHAQFSPVVPDLFSIAQDHWRDPYTGQQHGYDHRIWLMSPDGERFEAADPTAFHKPSDAGNEVSHEWWAADGTLCWTRYRSGVFEMNVSTREMQPVWERPVCHAHCDPTRRWWVCDNSPYFWPKPVELSCYDRETKKERTIVSAMPPPPVERTRYHIDPHPRFIGDGEWIAYTTTVRGQVDLAFTSTHTR